MQINVQVTDEVTPDLAMRIREQPERTRAALEKSGLGLVSMAKRAFSITALRPEAWAPLSERTIKNRKRQGFRGTAPLRASGSLWQSLAIQDLSSNSVTVGSDRKSGIWSIAAIHQLGAPRRKIPARPFFPVHADGSFTDRARRLVRGFMERIIR
jgi:phage gpG-like protein